MSKLLTRVVLPRVQSRSNHVEGSRDGTQQGPKRAKTFAPAATGITLPHASNKTPSQRLGMQMHCTTLCRSRGGPGPGTPRASCKTLLPPPLSAHPS
eukprot:7483267-Pyramimonas_sp.AAC.1